MKRAACSKCDASTALQVEKEMSAFFGKQGHNTGGTVERMKSASSQDMGWSFFVFLNAFWQIRDKEGGSADGGHANP
jgi:hypothetical protein